MKRVRVVIVDDVPHVREELLRVMGLCEGIEVVGDAENGREALRVVDETGPDVVLIDALMPDMDGFEATRRVKKARPEVWVVFLTMHSELGPDALSAGADEFLTKGCGIQELLEAFSPAGTGEN